jgi:predicted ferric reductase
LSDYWIERLEIMRQFALVASAFCVAVMFATVQAWMDGSETAKRATRWLAVVLVALLLAAWLMPWASEMRIAVKP